MMSDLLDRVRTALQGRYEIERELGAGGMATVYLARDTKHQRHVAVKVLRPDLAAILGGERFLREIEIAAQIEHPHILTLIDSGDADGILYYVMPYLEGESLRDWLSREGKLPVADAVRMLRDVADGLAEAHRHGLVHRDIKPDNVMISGNHAVVMDFGVAKAVSTATGPQNLTTAGIALGTPAYMAPEQVAAAPDIDHRTDIYAIGVLGYELLAGRPPFLGASAQEVLAAHIATDPEPVTTHRADTPPALEALVMKCLEKRAEDRWQQTDEVLRQLEAIATPSGGVPSMRISAAEAAKKPGRRVGMRTILIGAAVVAAAGLLFTQQRRAAATRALVAQLQLAVDSNQLGRVHSLLAESGRRLDQRALTSIARVAGGTAIIETEPPGASVQLVRALAPDSVTDPIDLGQTPIASLTLVAGEYRVTVSAEGHVPAEYTFRVPVGDTITVHRTLVSESWHADSMVFIDAGPVPGPVAEQFTGVQVPAFLIDRHEVSNEQFMQFVSDGGYRDPNLWPDSMLMGGTWTPRDRAIAQLVDRTGLSGPRTWSGGTFPDARVDHPVTSITWYEAAAYASWAGKALPTAEQWWRAALGDEGSRFPWGDDFTSIDDRSNFSMVGTTPVGRFTFGASPFGAHDMAGNVREWLAGSSSSTQFAVLGGSWQDPTYMFDTPNIEKFAPSFQGEAVGFRLVMPAPSR